MAFGSYYIHDGRKWRGVNLKDGSIEGWGRGKFVYAKGEVKGNLVAAKTSAVLTALRKLQCGKKSAARDGPRLPYKKINRSRGRSERHHISCCECRHPRSSCASEKINHSHGRGDKHYISCCECRHPRSSLCASERSLSKAAKTVIEITDENEPKNGEKVNTAIQTTKTFRNVDTVIQITDENVPKTVQKVDTAIQTTESTISKDNNAFEITDENVPPIASKTTSTPHKLSPIKLKKQWSLAGSDRSSLKRRRPKFNLNKKDSKNLNLYRRKSKSVDPPVYVVMPKTIVNNKEIIYDGKEYVKTKEIRHERSSSESGQELQQRVNRKSKSTRNIESKRQNVSNEKVSAQANFKPLSTQENTYFGSQRRELLIADDDVMLLRDFLMNNASNFDLLKFDEDVSYKMQFLYAVNPVVNVERCPKIQQMLRRDSVSEISLKDFASQLGLESVSEKNVPRRYKMRKRNDDANSENENDKSSKNASRKNTEHLEDSDSGFVKEKRMSIMKSNQQQKTIVTKEVKTRRINKEKDVSSHKRPWTEMDTDSDFEEQTGNVAQVSVKSKANQSIGDLKKVVKRKIDEIFSNKKVSKSDGDNSVRDSSPENVKGKAENIDLTKSDPDDSNSGTMSDRKKKENQNESKTKHADNFRITGRKSTNEAAKIDKMKKKGGGLVAVVKKNDNTENYKNGDGFAKPAICEVKSLAVDSKSQLERPASSASSLVRQEYSNFEDHAIVAWVKIGGRARQVNGNRIWKELEKDYQNITGQPRSWHSLRNRYLRSILPQLGQLALEPGLVSRLRSAAHTGELKARRAEPRRNSIYGAPAPPGALSRRVRVRRGHNADGESPAKDTKPDHTSEPHSSPQKDRSSSPADKASRATRYSKLICLYAGRPRESSSESSNDSPVREIPTRSSLKNQMDEKNTPKTRNSTKNLSLTKNTSRNLSETKNSSKEAPVSTTTKENKKSTETAQSSTRRSASKSGRKSTEHVGKKSRKLFNPNSII